MHSFGKRPVRALNAFGVAGLLGEECQVYFESLFSAKQVGKVSDLFVARLSRMGSDELRLRTMLLLTVYEAYRTQLAGGAPARPGAPLSEPMVIECGVDLEKIAVGIAFSLGEGRDLASAGLVERIFAGKAQDAFEGVLVELQRHADRLLIRYQASIRRVEIVTLLGIPGKIEAAQIQAKVAPELILIQSPETKEVKAHYIELADLDYAALLREDAPGEKLAAPSTGEILSKESKELEEAIRIRAMKAGPVEITRIGGVTDRIAGGEVTRIQGSGGDSVDQTVLRVGGAAGIELEKLKDEAHAYRLRIQELERELAAAKAGAAAAAEESSESLENEDSEDGEDADAPAENAIGGLFKKVWPFKKAGVKAEAMAGETEDVGEASAVGEGSSATAPADAGQKSPDAVSAGEIAPPDPDSASSAGAAKLADESATEGTDKDEATGSASSKKAPPVEDSAAESAASNLLVELQAGSLDRTLSKAQRESAEIKKDLGSAKAKRWVDGLMSELTQEKSRLQEFAKKVNLQVRQKELEFRNREQSLHEELRRRDDLIKQKNNALARTKDQLSQVSMSLERLKTAGAGGTDDAHFKQKYALTQKILTSVKDENTQLQAKIEDLKNQLVSAQLSNKSRNSASQAEYMALKTKAERSLKQLDELKRSNAQLMAQAAESAKSRSSAPTAGNIDDVKKRLDAAVRASATSQKEAEMLKLRVEELEREEQRLKAELERSLRDLKTLKSSAKPGGGAGAPPKAA